MFGKSEPLRTTSMVTSPAVEVFVTPDGTVCLSGRKEKIIEGRATYRCSGGELKHNLRARLCGAAYNPSPRQAEAEGSHIQSLDGFQSEFKASLDNSERLPLQNEELRLRLGEQVSGGEFA